MVKIIWNYEIFDKIYYSIKFNLLFECFKSFKTIKFIEVLNLTKNLQTLTKF